MDNLHVKIESDLKEAMKAGDTLRRSVLTLVKSALMNKAIEKKQKETKLADTEVTDIVSSEVKKRRDAIVQYRTGGRADMAENEEREIGVLLAYLPQQLTEQELDSIVHRVIAETGAQGEKDFGKVMGAVSKETKGKTDGTLVAQIVKHTLSKV